MKQQPAPSLTHAVSVLAAVALPLLVGCGDTSTNPDPDISPTFSSIQTEIFTKNCTTSSCHGALGQRGGLILEGDAAYANLVGAVPSNDSAKARGLHRVVAGKPDSSYLMFKLTGPRAGEGDLMPQGSSGLTAKAITAIRTWITNGAKHD